MAKYAKDTNVPVEKSIVDLRNVISRYGAKEFGIMDTEASVGVMFKHQGMTIRLNVPMPQKTDVRLDSLGRRIPFSQPRFDREIRQRWRALVLCVTAKLEAIDSGIETFEQAFMAHIVLAGGQTMSEVVLPQIKSGALMLLGSGKVN